MLSSIIMTICRYFTRNILQFKINIVKIIGIITIHYTLSLRTRSHLLAFGYFVHLFRHKTDIKQWPVVSTHPDRFTSSICSMLVVRFSHIFLRNQKAATGPSRTDRRKYSVFIHRTENSLNINC